MALRVYRIVVTSCPKSIYADQEERNVLPAAGKSSFCSRLVHPKRRPDEHSSTLTEKEWRENPVYNGDHFIYWGATTKRLKDGTKVRFQIVEQTEFLKASSHSWSPHEADEDYLKRASATHFISRGKVAYRCELDEAYAIPSSIRPGGFKRSTQIFPNQEFSEGNGVSGFICLFDPTLKGENIKRQVDYLEKLLKELQKTKRTILLACSKCDLADSGKIQLGEHLASSVAKSTKRLLPFIQTSAMEDINIEEAFRFIAESQKRKGAFRRSIRLNFRPFGTMMKERGVDEKYALATCKRIIQEKIDSFDTEWSLAKLELEADPKFYEAQQIAGEQAVKMSFCQRLMEVKVMELKEMYGARKRCDSRNYQSDLLGAFKKHPDLGSDDLYDYIHSPSFPSSDTSTFTSTRTTSSENLASVATPSRSDTRTSFPEVGTPLSRSYPPASPFSSSPSPPDPNPPTPPPTASIPTAHDTFSQGSPPANSPFHMISLNRSTEFLATSTIPRSNLSRNASLKTRTLPPLPNSNSFLSFHSRNDSLTASQPHLDEDFGEYSSDSFEKKRRLSNSLDCLATSGLEDSLTHTSGDSTTNLDKLQAEPYLRPVEIRQVVEKQDMPRSSRLLLMRSTIAGRTPRKRPSISDAFRHVPVRSIGRSKSFKEKDRLVRTRSRLSNGSTVSQPISGHEINKAAKPRTTSSSPPPLPESIIRPSVGSLISSRISDNSAMESYDGVRILSDTQSIDQDNISITSGPFTQIDDPPNEIDGLSTTPDVSPNRRLHILIDDNEEDEDDDEDDGFNVYAKIKQVEDQYLVMAPATASAGKRQIQEPSTPVKNRNSVQSIIKKLQQATTTPEPDKSSTVPYITTTSPQLQYRKLWRQSKKKSADSVLLSTTSGDAFSRSPYSVSPAVPSHSKKKEKLPLPPSPTKGLKKAMTITTDSRHTVLKKKGSLGGGHNIYESIDEGEEWLQQLRKRRSSQQHAIQAAMGIELMSKCQMAVCDFFSKPAVKQLWEESVKSVFPNYEPSSEEEFVPPFTLNPEHFKSLIQVERKKSVQENPAALIQADKTDETQEDEEEPLSSPEAVAVDQTAMEEVKKVTEQVGKPRPLTGKVSLSNSVLELLNQHLLTNHFEESSSSSSEEEDEEDEEEEDEEEEDDKEEEEAEQDADLSTDVESSDEENGLLQDATGSSFSYILQQPQVSDSDSPTIELDIPQSQPWTQRLHTSDSAQNQIDISATEAVKTKLYKPPTNSMHHELQTSFHSVTRNGHLALAPVNSLDSGISANGGYGTEEVS